MNLGENIYKFRTGKNMSQGDLADALEVSRQSVSKWENNSAVPELEKLMKMAEVFEITLDELVTGAQAKPPVSIQEEPPRVINENHPKSAFLSIPLFLFGILIFVFLPGHILSWLVGMPLLLAGIFVVFIGLHAHFEAKQKQPAPASPAAAATAAPNLSMQRICGVVLLAAAFCLFLALSFLSGILTGLIFASPLYVPGLICLFSKKHTGLKCAWAEFILIVTYFIWGTGTTWYTFGAYLQLVLLDKDVESSFHPISLVLSLVEWVLLAGLTIWTVYSYRLEARPFTKRSILPICLGSALYFLPDLLPLVSDIIPIRLLHVLNAGCIWLRVILFTVFLVHLWPTLRNWLERKKHRALPKTE